MLDPNSIFLYSFATNSDVWDVRNVGPLFALSVFATLRENFTVDGQLPYFIGAKGDWACHVVIMVVGVADGEFAVVVDIAVQQFLEIMLPVVGELATAQGEYTRKGYYDYGCLFHLIRY